MDIDPGDGFLMMPCRHAFCRECVEGYLVDKIMDGHVLDIHCLAPSCGSLFRYDHIKKLLPYQFFEKYEDFSLLAALKVRSTIEGLSLTAY